MVSLRTGMALLIMGTVVVVGMAVVVFEQSALRGVLAQQQERRALDIGQDVSVHSGDLISMGDWQGLSDLVQRERLRDADVRYVLVVGSGGEVFADTFDGQVPPELMGGSASATGHGSRPETVIGSERVQDVAVPVPGSPGGLVRVGMGDSSIRDAVALNTQHLIVLVAIITVAGAGVAGAVAFLVMRPLRRLVAAIRAIGAGHLSTRIAVQDRHEVGQLQMAFNTMASDLEAKDAARRQLLSKAVQSQEEERKRVARELHDEVAQRLTAILMGLEATQTTIPADCYEAKSRVMESSKAVAACLVEARRVMANLRPALLDNMGLKPAILSYAEDQLVPAGVQVSCDVSGLPPALAPHVEIAVFRILQEAINNAARHSKAKNVSITVSADGRYACGAVADDGCGFSTNGGVANGQADNGRLGILGMHERASLLGGALTVASQKGCGTKVSFVIPLHIGGN